MNPAYTGIYEATTLNIMHRSAWLGYIDGGGSSKDFQNAEFHAPLKNQSIAIGLQLNHKKDNGWIRNEVFFNYAHRIEMGSNKLTLGLRAGGMSVATDKDLFMPVDVVDPYFTSEYDGISPNFGVGVSFYSPNYYAGISIPYLLKESEIDVDMNDYSFILSGGAKFEVMDNLSIEPSGVFVYSLSLNPNYQALVNAVYNKLIIAGVGYRSGDQSIIANAGININSQISVLYSYDFNMANTNGDNVGAYSGGSHEIGLMWYFGYKINTVNKRDF